MVLRCVTFDLDDTLWDCLPALQQAERDFYQHLCQHLPRVVEKHDEATLLADRQAHYQRNSRHTHDVTFMRKHWLAEIAAEFGYGEEVIEPAFRVFWRGRNAVELYEPAEPCLRALKTRYTIGAITNGNADVHYIGIGQYFDFVVTPVEVGVAKPAAEIFQTALDLAGVDAGSALHVGDDPARDVRGAAAIGMRTVWVNPQMRAWPGGAVPDAVVRNVGELGAVLDHWRW